MKNKVSISDVKKLEREKRIMAKVKVVEIQGEYHLEVLTKHKTDTVWTAGDVFDDISEAIEKKFIAISSHANSLSI